jgi:hypothetical protein
MEKFKKTQQYNFHDKVQGEKCVHKSLIIKHNARKQHIVILCENKFYVPIQYCQITTRKHQFSD